MGRPLVLVVRDGAGLDVRRDTVQQRLLDLQVFRDGFDDPIAIGQARPRSSSKLPGAMWAATEGSKNAAGLLFFRPSSACGGDGARRGAGGRQVQKDDVHAGVGQVRGDARAHGSGAQHGGFADQQGMRFRERVRQSFSESPFSVGRGFHCGGAAPPAPGSEFGRIRRRSAPAVSGPSGSYQMQIQFRAPAMVKAAILGSQGRIDPSAIPSCMKARKRRSILRL